MACEWLIAKPSSKIGSPWKVLGGFELTSAFLFRLLKIDVFSALGCQPFRLALLGALQNRQEKKITPMPEVQSLKHGDSGDFGSSQILSVKATGLNSPILYHLLFLDSSNGNERQNEVTIRSNIIDTIKSLLTKISTVQ